MQLHDIHINGMGNYASRISKGERLSKLDLICIAEYLKHAKQLQTNVNELYGFLIKQESVNSNSAICILHKGF